jgi:hypothetical protein
MTEETHNTDSDEPSNEQLKQRVAALEAEVEDLTSGETVEDEQGRTWSLGNLMDLGLTRREAMVVLGAIGAGASFAGAFRKAMGLASANPDEVDVGTPSNPADVYASNVHGPHGDIDFQDPVNIGDATIENQTSTGALETTTESGSYHTQRDSDKWYFGSGDLGDIPDGSQLRIRFQAPVPYTMGVFRLMVVHGDTADTRASAIKQFTAQLRDTGFGPNETTNTHLLVNFSESDVTWAHTGANEEFDFVVRNNRGATGEDWAVDIQSLVGADLSLVEAVIETQ